MDSNHDNLKQRRMCDLQAFQSSKMPVWTKKKHHSYTTRTRTSHQTGLAIRDRVYVSKAVLRLQHFSGAFTDDHAGRHGVSSCHARHDGPVSNTEVIDSIDLESAIDNRHGIASHLGSTGLMRIARQGLSNKVF